MARFIVQVVIGVAVLACAGIRPSMKTHEKEQHGVPNLGEKDQELSSRFAGEDIEAELLLPMSGKKRPSSFSDRATDQKGEAQRGQFSKNCKLYPEKRVVLTTVNMEFLPMLKNWLHYAKLHLESTEQLRVVAEDGDVVAPLQEMQESGQFPQFALVTPNSTSSLLQVPFASEAYGSLVWKRPSHILDVLNEGCSVLYVDIDTVWAKDPFEDIAAMGDSSLVLTDDDPNQHGAYLCTCFMYVQPTTATLDLMTNWASHASGHRNQAIFNTQLKEMPADSGLKTAVLPVEKYPPGKSATEHPGATVFHANWFIGLEQKIQFMKDHGVWSIT